MHFFRQMKSDRKEKQMLTSILITEVKDNGLIIVSYHEIITLPDGRIYVGWTDCRFVVWIWSKGGRQKIQSRRGQVGIHFCANFKVLRYHDLIFKGILWSNLMINAQLFFKPSYLPVTSLSTKALFC